MLRAWPPPQIHSFQVQLFYSYYTPDPVLHAAQIRNRVGNGPCSQGFPSQRGRGKRQRRPWPACRLGVWLASCIPGVLLFEGWMVGDELTVQVVSRHEGRKRKRLPPCMLCQDYLSITYHRTTFPAKGGGGVGPWIAPSTLLRHYFQGWRGQTLVFMMTPIDDFFLCQLLAVSVENAPHSIYRDKTVKKEIKLSSSSSSSFFLIQLEGGRGELVIGWDLVILGLLVSYVNP